MAIKDKILTPLKEKWKEVRENTSVWLNDQEWFQELKEKWDELDTKSKIYLKNAFSISLAFGIVFVAYSAVSTVSETRRVFREKKELLELIREARGKTDDSKGQLGRSTPESFFTFRARAAGLQPSQYKTKKNGTEKANGSLIETLLDVELNRVNIRQISKLLFEIDNNEEYAKLRHVTISTAPGKDGAKGFLNASVSLSHYTTPSNEEEAN